MFGNIFNFNLLDKNKSILKLSSDSLLLKGNPDNSSLKKRVNKIFDHDLNKMKEIIHAFSFTDYETEDAIKNLLKKNKYFYDHHGAIGYLGAKKYIDNNKINKEMNYLRIAVEKTANEDDLIIWEKLKEKIDKFEA